jgi:hypothetical protein
VLEEGRGHHVARAAVGALPRRTLAVSKGSQLEIFNSVVSAITVDMVDRLVSEKRAFQMKRHNPAMLQ